jgi:hypothetical protein
MIPEVDIGNCPLVIMTLREALLSPGRFADRSGRAHHLAIVEGLHATPRNICETTIQRGERLGVERRPVFVSGVAEVLKPHVREFGPIFRQLIHELVQRFAYGHAWPSISFIITPPPPPTGTSTYRTCNIR